MDWSSIVGTAAAVCMILGYLPQAITTIRTRDTDGIAIPHIPDDGPWLAVFRNTGYTPVQLAAGYNQHHNLCMLGYSLRY